ncbi:MAG: elongation factor G [Planctomycetes bacterium]|nr:elongation factor G [Planctomycetota bacterium]
MTHPAPSDLRNVVMVGHGDAGKTTLAEHVLASAGAIQRVGTIKERTTFLDYEADEKERHHTISLAIARLNHAGKTIALVDTPGYPDFIGDVSMGIDVADFVLVCVNAHSGVMVNTRKVFQMAHEAGKARAIVVTKCDAATGPLTEVLERIRTAFGSRCVPWNAPAALGDRGQEWVEAVVEVDDNLMARYLEGDALAPEEIARASRLAVAVGRVVPVVFTSADKNEGVDTVLKLITELGPSPADAKRVVAPKSDPDHPPEPMAALPDAPFLGYVWRVQIDRHVGKFAHVRIIQGQIKAGDNFVVFGSEKRERALHILKAHGRDSVEVTDAGPGELVVLPRLDSLHLGDVIGHHTSDLVVRRAPCPVPMYALAVAPKTRGDEAKISEALHKMAEECPTFVPHRESATHEQVVNGMSQLHLDIMLKRMKERFGVEVEVHKPRIAYKECVLGAAEGHYRHKKQSGGRGQFAEVFLAVAPAPAGSGLVWSWDIFGGSIPRNFEPAIEKGVREKMVHGVVAGYALPDVKVSIRDGKFHDVDSSEAAFKIAGGRAFIEAVTKARATLQEPHAHLEIVIPGRCMGDVSGDLTTRRGRIIGMDQQGDLQVLKAEMPLVEASDYARALTALTSGEGTFTMTPGPYMQVPAALAAQLAAAYKPHHGDED